MSSESTVQTSNKSAHPFEEWKYCRPADLTKALPIYWKEWKFCPKCKCRATGKEGIYQLSHWAKDHIDGYGQQSTVTGIVTLEPSANLSHHVLDPSDGVTSGPPEVTVTEEFPQHVRDQDEIEFLGMWCAPVVQLTCPSVAVKHFTKRGVKNVSEIDVNEIKNVYEIYKNEFEKENYKNEFDKNESENKNLSEIYKIEFEIENGRSEIRQKCVLN